MRIFTSLDELDGAFPRGTCLTIGVFDAIHRGHQALIGAAMREAKAEGAASLVFTFDRHPLAVLAPAYCPPMILRPERKAELIGELGADFLLMLPFTAEFAATPAEAFVEDILVRRCRARYIVSGLNFSFGAGAKGGPDLLRAMAPRLGFQVEVLDPVVEGHSMVSSSRIRQALLQGDVADAAAMLTRRYGFSARVVPGHQRGRTIGYPTANLEAAAGQLIPADGVYAALARVPGGAVHGGMLNAGKRPTFEGAGRAMEVHLFGFDGELTGSEIEIEFIERIRDEKKFASLEDLIAQLRMDEVRCREISLAALAGA